MQFEYDLPEYTLDAGAPFDESDLAAAERGGVMVLDKPPEGESDSSVIMEPVPVFDRKDLRLQDVADGMTEACAESYDSERGEWDAEKCYVDPAIEEEKRFNSSSTGAPGPFCYGCRVSTRDIQGNMNRYCADIERIISDNYNGNVPSICVNLLFAYYEENIRRRIPGRPRWDRVTILDHIERHNPTRGTIVQVELRTINTLCGTLEDSGLMVRDTINGQVQINEKNVRVYTALIKERQRILNSAVSQGRGRPSNSRIS